MTSSYELRVTSYDLPGKGLAAAVHERALFRPVDLHLGRRLPRGALERDRLGVGLEPVMARAVERGEGLELVERVLLREHLRVGLDRDRRIEQPRRPHDVELARDRVRRRVGPEEEPRLAGGRRTAQRGAVLRRLDDRRAV